MKGIFLGLLTVVSSFKPDSWTIINVVLGIMVAVWIFTLIPPPEKKEEREQGRIIIILMTLITFPLLLILQACIELGRWIRRRLSPCYDKGHYWVNVLGMAVICERCGKQYNSLQEWALKEGNPDPTKPAVPENVIEYLASGGGKDS